MLLEVYSRSSCNLKTVLAADMNIGGRELGDWKSWL